MQTIGPTLPELNGTRRETVSSPIGRQRDLSSFIFRHQLLKPAFQHLSTGNHLTLPGGKSTDLAFPGAGSEIGFRFLSGNLANRSRDADLSFQLAPVKNQRCVCILGQFRTLAAFVVGIKHKTTLIEILEQDHPAGKLSLSGCCGQASSFRQNRLSRQGRLKPLLKLFKRIGIQVLPGETRLGLLQGFNFH